MDQATATVIAAVLALIGVLAGLGMGARRWHRERRDSRTADFIKDRHAAYRSLWSNVEGLSVALRTETLADEAFIDRVRDLNADLLKAGLYIEDADRQLASAYIRAVERFHSIVSSSDDPAARVSFGSTGEIPPEVLERVRDLRSAQERATQLRTELVQRIRVVLNDNAG